MKAAEWCRKEGLKPGDLVDAYGCGEWHGPYEVTAIGREYVLYVDNGCRIEYVNRDHIRRHVPPVVAPTAEEWAEAVRAGQYEPGGAAAKRLCDLLDRHDRAKRGVQ